MSHCMLDSIRDTFDGAPAWSKPVPGGGPPNVMAVTFRRPEDPSHPDALPRYYQPVGETLALLARRAGCDSPQGALLALVEGEDESGPWVTVKVGLAP